MWVRSSWKAALRSPRRLRSWLPLMVMLPARMAVTYPAGERSSTSSQVAGSGRRFAPAAVSSSFNSPSATVTVLLYPGARMSQLLSTSTR